MSPSGNDIHSDDLRPTSRPLFPSFLFCFFFPLSTHSTTIYIYNDITAAQVYKYTYRNLHMQRHSRQSGCIPFFFRRRWISLNFKWQRRNLLDTKVEMIVGGAGFGSINSATHPHGLRSSPMQRLPVRNDPD